jgi:hypothetical protein
MERGGEEKRVTLTRSVAEMKRDWGKRIGHRIAQRASIQQQPTHDSYEEWVR